MTSGKVKASLASIALVATSVCNEAVSQPVNSWREDSVQTWHLFEHYSEAGDHDSLFAKMDAQFDSEHLKFLNRIAYTRILNKRGRKDQALKVMSDLEERLHLANPYATAEYYGMMGTILLSAEEPERARRLHKRSIGLLRHTNYPESLQAKYVNLGVAFAADGMYDSAMYCYEQAEAMEGSKSARNVLYLHLNKAWVSSELGYLEQAKHDFLHALKVFESTPDSATETRVLGSLGDIYTDQDSLGMAEQYYLRGHQMALSLELEGDMYRFDRSLANLYEDLGRFEQAHFHFTRADSVHVALKSDEVSKKVLELEMTHQLRLEEQARLAKAKLLEQERKERQILSVAIGIIGVALLVLIWQLWLLKRKNRFILKQNLVLVGRQPVVEGISEISERHSPHPELINGLERLMIQKGLYRDSSLTVDRLAKRLKTNRTYLSEAINAHYNMNFSQWLNQWRIDEARKLLVSTDHQHYSIEGISQMVGFASISAFNSNFKRISGLTPSYYRKNASRG